MNSLIASSYDATKGFFLPASRIYGADGLTLEALSAIGIIVVGDKTAAGFRRCMLPEGWTPVAASESTMQVRLQDGQGRLRAKIFYKPGSQGGGASMQLWTRFTVQLKTSDDAQWAEVYDGNELIHTTDKGAKTVDKLGFTASSQPQYVSAESWLDSRWPDHKNPLAYWN